MSGGPPALFVYGTLQRGQVRAGMWPQPPPRVEPATTRGQLYDLGPYPAMVAGDGLVRGELWHVEPQHLAETLAVLDAIEGCGTGGRDLFVRRIVQCRTDDGRSERAYAYFYARPDELASARLVPASPDGSCRWPSGSTRS